MFSYFLSATLGTNAHIKRDKCWRLSWQFCSNVEDVACMGKLYQIRMQANGIKSSGSDIKEKLKNDKTSYSHSLRRSRESG